MHRYRWTQPAEDGEGWGCTPRAYHSTTFVPDHGRLVVFGGFAGGRPMTRLEVYDVARAQWVVAEATGREPAPRFGHSATAAGPCVVGAGGSTGGHNHKGLRTSGDDGSAEPGGARRFPKRGGRATPTQPDAARPKKKKNI